MKVASWSAYEPGLLHVNLDVGSHHTDSVADDIIVGRRTKNLSGPNIELGAMQWAGHFVSRDLSLGQRSLLVRAHVVDGEELAVDVEQGNLFTLYIDQSGLPGIDLVSPCNLHKVGHPCSPSLPVMASIRPLTSQSSAGWHTMPPTTSPCHCHCHRPPGRMLSRSSPTAIRRASSASLPGRSAFDPSLARHRVADRSFRMEPSTASRCMAQREETLPVSQGRPFIALATHVAPISLKTTGSSDGRTGNATPRRLPATRHDSSRPPCALHFLWMFPAPGWAIPRNCVG